MKSFYLNSEVHMTDMTSLRLSFERSRLDLSKSVRFGFISFEMSEKIRNEDTSEVTDADGHRADGHRRRRSPTPTVADASVTDYKGNAH